MQTTRSEELFAAAKDLIPGGVNSPVRAFKSVGGTPRFIDRGEGAYFWDADGNRYIDYVLSWGPLVLGHAHPDVVEALAEAAKRGTSYGAPTALETELAQLVVDTVPSVEMVIYAAVGGRLSLVGAVYGAVLVGSAKTFFSENFVEYWMYFIGVLFVVIVMFLPDGLAGLLEKLGARKAVQAPRDGGATAVGGAE